VFSLMLRYQSLDGGGFQCALPPPVFKCLKKSGFTLEGFASPLNCCSGARRYCSAFEDTDSAFGSLGSFFRLPRRGLRGRWQLNPPFSVDTYTALVATCHEMLDAADQANEVLAFAIFLGGTEAALRHPSVAALAASPYLQGRLHVGVAEHVYLCGRQHMQAEVETFRACDTEVFILESQEARRLQATKPDAVQLSLRALHNAFRQTNQQQHAHSARSQ
jgi:hypothetical protein